MKNRTMWALAAVLTAAGPVRAADQALRVAVFPFETESGKDSPKLADFIRQATGATEQSKTKPLTLGDKIADLVTQGLADNPAIALVERAKIDQAYEELALGKTGLVDEKSAARIGHIVGAQILITGRAFPLDDDLYIVAKVIGAETTRVFVSKVHGPMTGQLAPLAADLSGKVSKILLAHDEELVGREKPIKDYQALLKKGLGEAKRPSISVFVTEKHVRQETIDPTVDTELMSLFKDAGFEVFDEKNMRLADWAKTYLDDGGGGAPPSGGKADVIIVGQTFSEFAARRGDLISTKARVELRAIDAKTGKVLSVGSRTATAVDLAENFAAKNALREAAQELSLKIIPELVKNYPK